MALLVSLLLLTAWGYPTNHQRTPNHTTNCRWHQICEQEIEVHDTTVAYAETGKVRNPRRCRPRHRQACARQSNRNSGKTLLFLHGRAFSKQDWIDSGILARATRSGNRAIAIDLPGYGDTPPTSIDNGQFLADMIQALNLDPESLVVVSPSLSGFFALDLLDLKPTIPLAGFVAISPKGVPTFGGLTTDETIPTLVMWADQDPAIPVEQAEILAGKIPGSQVKLFESDSHPFYFDLTRQFNLELAHFVRRLE